jgi:hypothetical protein
MDLASVDRDVWTKNLASVDRDVWTKTLRKAFDDD